MDPFRFRIGQGGPRKIQVWASKNFEHAPLLTLRIKVNLSEKCLQISDRNRPRIPLNQRNNFSLAVLNLMKMFAKSPIEITGKN